MWILKYLRWRNTAAGGWTRQHGHGEPAGCVSGGAGGIRRRPHQPHTAAPVRLRRGSAQPQSAQLRRRCCLACEGQRRGGGCLAGRGARAGRLPPQCAAAAARPCLQPIPPPPSAHAAPAPARSAVSPRYVLTCARNTNRTARRSQAPVGFTCAAKGGTLHPSLSPHKHTAKRPPSGAAGRKRHACTVAAAAARLRTLLALSVRRGAPQVGGLWRPRKR